MAPYIWIKINVSFTDVKIPVTFTINNNYDGNHTTYSVRVSTKKGLAASASVLLSGTAVFDDLSFDSDGNIYYKSWYGGIGRYISDIVGNVTSVAVLSTTEPSGLTRITIS